ncbi:MAG: hypothetical protein AAF355_00300 [Myxococcota bacterium]
MVLTVLTASLFLSLLVIALWIHEDRLRARRMNVLPGSQSQRAQVATLRSGEVAAAERIVRRNLRQVETVRSNLEMDVSRELTPKRSGAHARLGVYASEKRHFDKACERIVDVEWTVVEVPSASHLTVRGV